MASSHNLPPSLTGLYAAQGSATCSHVRDPTPKSSSPLPKAPTFTPCLFGKLLPVPQNPASELPSLLPWVTSYYPERILLLSLPLTD